MAVAASLVATAVSGVFSATLLRRYSRRRTRPLLFWGLSLAMFSVASLALLIGVVAGWSGAAFRIFYLFGAVLNVPWLALGSVAVNARSRAVSRATGVATLATGLLFASGVVGGEAVWLWLPGAVLGILWGLLQLALHGEALVTTSLALVSAMTAVSAAVVLGAGFTAPLPVTALPEGSELFTPFVRGFAVGGNAVGAIIVVVGAVAATVALVWRPAGRAGTQTGSLARRAPVEALARWLFNGRKGLPVAHLVRGNLLIALGVLIAASGGALAFLGATAGHAVAIAAGVSVMFAGFVRTTRPVAAAPDRTAPAVADPAPT